MSITLLGETVIYRQKAMPKNRFICDAVITKIHDDKKVDLYTLRPGVPYGVYVDMVNQVAYLSGRMEESKMKYNVEYSEEPIPGTWGGK